MSAGGGLCDLDGPTCNGSKAYEDLFKPGYLENMDCTGSAAAPDQSSVGISGDAMVTGDMADMLLKPQKTSGKEHLQIVDFIDNICQNDDERLLADQVSPVC